VQNGESSPATHSRAIHAVSAAATKAGALVLGFVASRRWLLAVMLATCALLAILALGKPKHILVAEEPDEPETKFDEVTNLGAASGSSGWLHRWSADAARRVEKNVPGLTLGTPPADDSEPPDSVRLTRRLDAVRARQSRGAVLTGKIDAVDTTARQRSNAPLRPPAEVLPRTADSTAGGFDGNPESAFR
jgi:hypothetical protein